MSYHRPTHVRRIFGERGTLATSVELVAILEDPCQHVNAAMFKSMLGGIDEKLRHFHANVLDPYAGEHRPATTPQRRVRASQAQPQANRAYRWHLRLDFEALGELRLALTLVSPEITHPEALASLILSEFAPSIFGQVYQEYVKLLCRLRPVPSAGPHALICSLSLTEEKAFEFPLASA